MGTVKLFKCSCGYEKTLFMGCGLSAMRLDAIKASVPENIYAQFESEKNARKIKDFILSHAVLSCPDCLELNTVPDFSYETTADKKIRWTAPCPVCRKSCAPIDNSEHIFCPKCGREMTSNETGQWD